MSSYSQPVFTCPDNATQVKLDDDNWTYLLNKNNSYPLDKKQGYLLAENIHQTQALVEFDGSLPFGILVKNKSKIECADQNGAKLTHMEERKKYSG